MRRIFGKLMVELAERDKDVLLLVGDIGYRIFDEYRSKFPKRFINMGLCEQSMISVASGMALEGLKPYVYTITPFLIERPFEQIKLDINQQNVNVKLVGYADYPKQGPTHSEIDARGLMSLLDNVKSFFPKSSEDTINFFWEAYKNNGPAFISLKEDKKYKKFGEISDILAGQLPEIIKKIAKERSISEYAENPDFFDERLRKWHQYGLLTHTLKTKSAFSERLDTLLKTEGFYGKVEERMQEKIEGVEKKTLFNISIVLHDLGKVTCLHQNREDRGHEYLSATLLDTEFLENKLKATGLEKEHINYIRKCIETHDVIGKRIRDELKRQGKLSLDYVNNEDVKERCKSLAKEYDDVKLEIGLFFLCDTFGKLSIDESEVSGCQPAEKEIKIIDLLKSKGLHEDLRFGVMQQQVTLNLGEVYLKEVI